MAKGSRGRCRVASRQHRPTPYSFPSLNHNTTGRGLYPKKCSKALDKKDWEDATCSVCMECPHNAVLLLCSSHDKGCRPYMCGTSFRFSNCLDQYKKAYTKVISSNHGQSLPGSVDSLLIPDSSLPTEKCEVMELACPLCRGQVKGWTVVEPAREFLNAKRRNCMQEDCSFVGTYKELRKHMKADHPSARPREVDPLLEQKWRRFERGERDDVISTIRSTMPGAMVFGDYVIEGNNYGYDTDAEDGRFVADSAERDGGFEAGFDGNLVNVFLLLHAFGAGNDLSRRARQSERTLHRTSDENDVGIRHTTPVGGLDFSDHDEDNDGNNDHEGMSLVSRLRRHGRVLLNRSGRRRRRREVNEARGR